jgi:GT2 family glycosyltransferase
LIAKVKAKDEEAWANPEGKEFRWVPMSYSKSEAKMRNYPKVSIIIPTWNGLELLKISIPALLKTHYPNIEVIVVDNGSSDGSVSFLSKVYPKVSVIPLEENKGIVIPYNLGASAAHGSLVSFLSNDMEVDPNWLLPLVLAMQRNEHVACCDSKYFDYYERNKIDSSGGAGKFIDNYGNAVNRGGGETDKGQFNIQEEVFYGLLLFRKDLFMKAGGFDESFFGWYDETDLCWRLHRLGYKVLFVPESTVYHIGSASSSERGPKKKPKKFSVFHYYKNKLRMLIKNQFGISLLLSILVYFVDLSGIEAQWLLAGDVDYFLILLKALIWNLRNLRGTLQNRIRFKNEPTDFHKLFFPYSGYWVQSGLGEAALRSLGRLSIDRSKKRYQD